MGPRAGQYITLGGKGGPMGSVRMFSLCSNQVVTRDYFFILPMLDIVVQKITEQAHRQGYTRGADPTLELPDVLDENVHDAKLPDMMTIYGRDEEPIGSVRNENALDDDKNAPPTRLNIDAQDQPADATNANDSLDPESSTASANSRELRALRRYEGFIKPSIATVPDHFLQSPRNSMVASYFGSNDVGGNAHSREDQRRPSKDRTPTRPTCRARQPQGLCF